jgi:hypothetical protein
MMIITSSACLPIHPEIRDLNYLASNPRLSHLQKKPLIVIDPRVEDYHQLRAAVETQATILLLDQS